MKQLQALQDGELCHVSVSVTAKEMQWPVDMIYKKRSRRQFELSSWKGFEMEANYSLINSWVFEIMGQLTVIQHHVSSKESWVSSIKVKD